MLLKDTPNTKTNFESVIKEIATIDHTEHVSNTPTLKLLIKQTNHN